MGGKPWISTVFGVLLALVAAPASAISVGGVGGAVGGVGRIGGGLGLPSTQSLTSGGLPLNLPGSTLGNPVQANLSVGVDPIGRPLDTRVITVDPFGQKIVRGEVLAIAPTDADLDAARKLNFSVRRRETFTTLGVEAVSLTVPGGMDIAVALAALRTADPTGNFDLDHIYDPSGSAMAPSAQGENRGAEGINAHDVTIGMIDAGVYTRHRAFTHGEIITKNVTRSDAPVATEHGTAVASLLVGNDDSFHGELPGAKLYAADAFGGDPTGGSALDIARALDWLAREGVVVVNASLAGPPNALLAATVHSFLASGHVLVAAAGNFGPAARAAYPAAYDGVIGVTSVDARRHLELDASQGDVSFAALGVDVRAAALDVEYRTYTGTSFAAPVVAAHFATLIASPDPVAARNARDVLARSAERIGKQSAYGFGYVGPVSPSLAVK
jgi:subtilisin family serine protease